jgi:hypothetical protein
VLPESCFAFGCLANVDVPVLTFEDVDVYHAPNEQLWTYETTEVQIAVEVVALGQNSEPN